MSSNGRLGARKHRRAEARAGEPLLAAFAWGYHVEAITRDDRHLWLDRDGSPPQLIDDPIHWHSICPDTPAHAVLRVLRPVRRMPR